MLNNKRKIQKELLSKISVKHGIVGFMGPNFKEYHSLVLNQFKEAMIYEKDLKIKYPFKFRPKNYNLSLRYETLTKHRLLALTEWFQHDVLFDFDFCTTIKNNRELIKYFFQVYKNSNHTSKFIFTFSLRNCSYLETIQIFEELGGWFLDQRVYKDSSSMLVLTNIL